MNTITMPHLGTVKLTPERIKRINQAIQETMHLLTKELTYSPDLRKHDRVIEYLDHIKKLENYLTPSN